MAKLLALLAKGSSSQDLLGPAGLDVDPLSSSLGKLTEQLIRVDIRSISLTPDFFSTSPEVDNMNQEWSRLRSLHIILSAVSPHSK